MISNCVSIVRSLRTSMFLSILALLCIPVPSITQTFISSNLPIVFIDTDGRQILNEPKIDARMRIIDNGPGKRNALTDTIYRYNGNIGIEIRGSSSQQFPKKQYGFETRDSAGADMDASLLGLPAESDWILSAQYNDKTLMRDVLAYTLSNAIGRYASRYRYCEVILNGSYHGVYILLEKIKRDKNRVNIAKGDENALEGDEVTGGYILKVDKMDGSGNDGWTSPIRPVPGMPWKTMYQYHYPAPEDMTPVQKVYIQKRLLSMEAALYSPMFMDRTYGYPRYFDIPSMVDYFLLTELAKNVDGYRLSMFFYKERDTKDSLFHLGPIWDFNHSFGNCDYYDVVKTAGWHIDFLATNSSYRTNDSFQPTFWWPRIAGDETFRAAVVTRWKQLRSQTLTRARIRTVIDSTAALLNEAQQRNFVRWPVLGMYVWPNAFVGQTYASEVTYLKNWADARITWMDSALTGGPLRVEEGAAAPLRGFSLLQNYPNPFNPGTAIRYQVTAPAVVTLSVYDMLGREAAVLVNEWQGQGTYTVQFNGAGLASGAYRSVLRSGTSIQSRSMLLLK